MHVLITSDTNGGQAFLTTDSPASSYGIPVLEVTGKDVSGTFGPADMIGNVDNPETLFTAADVVIGWAMQAGRNAEEIAAARMFLTQWPEGPQIPA